MFFEFPENDSRKTNWLNACGLDNIGKHGKLCSKHFDNSHFINENQLKPIAVPILYLGATTKNSENTDSNDEDMTEINIDSENAKGLFRNIEKDVEMTRFSNVKGDMITVHSGNFECSKDSKKYSNVSFRKSFNEDTMDILENISSNNEDRSKLFLRCFICDENFPNEKGLEHHVSVVHERNEQVGEPFFYCHDKNIYVCILLEKKYHLEKISKFVISLTLTNTIHFNINF